MRSLIALLMFPALCHALGADSEEYVGIAPNGKRVRLAYLSDPAPWTDGNFIYGSKSTARLRYCWTVENRDPDARYAQRLQCASVEGGTPGTLYRDGNYNYRAGSGFRYQDAMRHMKKIRSKREGLIQYYVCESGCDSSTPLFLFEVAHPGK